MRESVFAKLSVVGMRGCEDFASQVDYYLKDWRNKSQEETFLVDAECPRFGTGEGKGLVPALVSSQAGHQDRQAWNQQTRCLLSYRTVIVWLQNFQNMSQKANESEILQRVEDLS